jgi:hypothetical protein
VPARFQFDDFVLDLDAFRLERGGFPVALEPKALWLLALMVRRPNHLFTKQEIFSAVWPDTAVTDHALTRIIAQVRRALGDEAREARYLETVPDARLPLDPSGGRARNPGSSAGGTVSSCHATAATVVLPGGVRRRDGGRARRAGLGADGRVRPFDCAQGRP